VDQRSAQGQLPAAACVEVSLGSDMGMRVTRIVRVFSSTDPNPSQLYDSRIM
jgi:hypothetical protein